MRFIVARCLSPVLTQKDKWDTDKEEVEEKGDEAICCFFKNK
jgi:hypothetical protein